MSSPKNLTPKQSTGKKLTPEEIEKMRIKDRTLVRGKYHFHECPGGMIQFPFKKYAADPMEWYKMTDGEVHTIPLGVAKHLTDNCWYPEYSYRRTEGQDLQQVTKKIPRMSFQSMEFSDYDDIRDTSGERVNTAVYYPGRSV